MCAFFIILTSAVYYAGHCATEGHEGYYLIRSNKLNTESITAPLADGDDGIPFV